MKYINNSFYFVPRFDSFLNQTEIPLTVDNTYITVDSTFITADQTSYLVQGNFILELTNELTKEVTFPTFDWEVDGSFIKITFEQVYSGNYSVFIYNDLGTIYKGRLASECIRTEIINNKMYL